VGEFVGTDQTRIHQQAFQRLDPDCVVGRGQVFPRWEALSGVAARVDTPPPDGTDGESDSKCPALPVGVLVR
jgi:hypothetical protein